MEENRVIKSTEEQNIGAIVDMFNQIRDDKLQQNLSVINIARDVAAEELQTGIDSIRKVIETNRGGEKGMHGFIGERAQVHISNSVSIIRGEEPLYHLINDNGPTDYLRGDTLIQQKACRSGGMLGLDHVKAHSETYPLYTKDGGIYQIPKDFYEIYNRMMHMPENIATKMSNPEYRLWKKIHEFSSGNSDIKIEPMLVAYKDIQAETIESTMHRASAENEKIYQKRHQSAINDNKATFKEGARITACSAIMEGGIEGILCLVDKIKSGRRIPDFIKGDWKDICNETAKGTCKGAIRGAAVYTLTNTIGTPAPIATATVTFAFDVTSETGKYQNGDISGKECAKNICIHCLDVSVSAASSMIGAKYITKFLPKNISSRSSATIIGSLIGNGLGMIIYSIAKDEVNKKAKEH